jgi:hypothetical protein
MSDGRNWDCHSDLKDHVLPQAARHAMEILAGDNRENGVLMKRRILSSLGIAIGLVSGPSLADVGTLSRANCVGPLQVNESVTYDRPQLRTMIGFATSVHTQLGNVEPLHAPLFSDSAPSWRHYAGDTGDGGTVLVAGTHGWRIYDDDGNIVEEGYRETSATDCNLTEW